MCNMFILTYCIGLVTVVVSCDGLTSLNSRIRPSENLVTLLDTSLAKCTFRVVLNDNTPSAEVLLLLQNHYSQRISAGASFILNHYFPKLIDMALEYYKNSYKTNDSKIFWHLKRHSSCSAHLYIIEKEKDLGTAVWTHFPNFVFRKESPAFIIFWDTMKIQSNSWKLIFNLDQFYNSFMDYRIYISRSRGSHQYDTSLICIPCSSYMYRVPNARFLI